jgi:hypothetical protein
MLCLVSHFAIGCQSQDHYAGQDIDIAQLHLDGKGLLIKRFGFLSFGHCGGSPGSQTCSASLLQSIELAIAADELGADGAYFRIHHFAKQISSCDIAGEW